MKGLINRTEHSSLFDSVCFILKPHLSPDCYAKLSDPYHDEIGWVDKVPTPVLHQIHSELISSLDSYTANSDLRYPWSLLKGHLLSCHIYLSPFEISIRPLIPPTWSHTPFESAKQRIYMSATLGNGGDLERLFGIKNIYRIPIPDSCDLHGVGRRFFMFPSLSLEHEEVVKLRRNLLSKAQRALVLVPSDRQSSDIVEDIGCTLKGFKIFSAEDIEHSKEEFVKTKPAVAVIANRYDGIDFPGDECRLLFIDGLPKVVNSQERFLMSRMGANVLFQGRVQTRVLQAIGRCTRSLEDYSAVVVTGDEIPDYLADIKRRDFLHPELQAELWFGVEQSKNKTAADFKENFDIFIQNAEEWEQANQQIVDYRQSATQHHLPCIEQLQKSVAQEIQYQFHMWQHDYIEALSCSESVLSSLTDTELQGYRALWEYLAGSAAYLAAQTNTANRNLLSKSKEHFSRAKKATRSIPWLVQLAQYSTQPGSELDEVSNRLISLQVENIERMLEKLGTLHERKFNEREKLILEGLDNEEQFENAHKELGCLLGFYAGKIEDQASPDPWWHFGNFCLVFEDHANAQASSSLCVTKARQVASHPVWMKEHIEACKTTEMEILPVLVTPVTKADNAALPHLVNVSLWKLDDFKLWSRTALETIREIRKTFSTSGDLAWRAEAAEKLKNNQLDMQSLFQQLKTKSAKSLLSSKK